MVNPLEQFRHLHDMVTYSLCFLDLHKQVSTFVSQTEMNTTLGRSESYSLIPLFHFHERVLSSNTFPFPRLTTYGSFPPCHRTKFTMKLSACIPSSTEQSQSCLTVLLPLKSKNNRWHYHHTSISDTPYQFWAPTTVRE